MKTVKRTWYSKRRGEYVTKIYTYAHESTKGLVLVNKRGVVQKKNVEAFKRAIDANTEYDENYKRMLKADVDNYIETRKGKNNKQLTTSGFLGHEKSDKLNRMFTNLGYSSEELSEVTGIDEDVLTNSDNWDFSNGQAILNVNGKRYKMKWTYTGSVLEEVNEQIR